MALTRKDQLKYEEEIIDSIMNYIISIEKRYALKTKRTVQVLYNVDDILFIEDEK